MQGAPTFKYYPVYSDGVVFLRLSVTASPTPRPSTSNTRRTTSQTTSHLRIVVGGVHHGRRRGYDRDWSITVHARDVGQLSQLECLRSVDNVVRDTVRLLRGCEEKDEGNAPEHAEHQGEQRGGHSERRDSGVALHVEDDLQCAHGNEWEENLPLDRSLNGWMPNCEG